MSSLNNIFVEYSKIVEKVDSTFNVEKSFFNKILEIVAVIQHGNSSFNAVNANSTGSGSTVSGGGKKEEISLFINSNSNKGKSEGI